jgi:endonuclease/exonuclease/phosphatase family metal-dependent hydrolase
MKIVCLNAWGGALAEPLMAWLSDVQPDVLCLQEVVHSPQTAKTWLTYRDGTQALQQRANFFLDVAGCLPDHFAMFCPAAQGVLWDGQTPVPSQWGLATFVRQTIPIIGQALGFVHKDFSPDGYGDHPRSRNAHALRLYDQEADRAIVITHMHGLRDLAGKMDTPERAVQARKLLDLANQASMRDDFRIFCGDFNVEPDSATFTLLRAAGCVELVTSRGFHGTRTSHYVKPNKFADYMFVSDASLVKGFDVIRTPEISDHCPLALEI